MFAIAFDLVVAETRLHHPFGTSAAYNDVARTIAEFGFTRVQGSVYTCDNENLANLYRAISALKALEWFPKCVRDIRAFRVEQWSDFTDLIKS